MQSKRIAVSAVMTAIAWILIAIARVSPIGTFSILVLCEVTVFCVFLLSGTLAGFLCLLATVLFSFLFLPHGWVFIVVFAPHCLISGIFFVKLSAKKERIILRQKATQKEKQEKPRNIEAPFGADFENLDEGTAFRTSWFVSAEYVIFVLLRFLCTFVAFNVSIFVLFKITERLFLNNFLTEIFDSYFWIAFIFSIGFVLYDFLFFKCEARLAKFVLRFKK